MAKTTNEYWIFLEELRRPYLMEAFELDKSEATKILADWMRNYNPEDYDE